MPTHTGSKNRSGPTKHTRGKKNKGKGKQISKNDIKKSTRRETTAAKKTNKFRTEVENFSKKAFENSIIENNHNKKMVGSVSTIQASARRAVKEYKKGNYIEATKQSILTTVQLLSLLPVESQFDKGQLTHIDDPRGDFTSNQAMIHSISKGFLGSKAESQFRYNGHYGRPTLNQKLNPLTRKEKRMEKQRKKPPTKKSKKLNRRQRIDRQTLRRRGKLSTTIEE